jgi:hypothetical protein
MPLTHQSQVRSFSCFVSCDICDVVRHRAARGERFALESTVVHSSFALPLWHRKKVGAAPEPPQRAGRQTRTHARTEPVQCASRTHPRSCVCKSEPLHSTRTHYTHVPMGTLSAHSSLRCKPHPALSTSTTSRHAVCHARHCEQQHSHNPASITSCC